MYLQLNVFFFFFAGDIISQEILPEKLLPRCLDILSKLSSGERDLIRIVVEVIQDLRDPGDVERDLEIVSDHRVKSSLASICI